VFNDPVGSFPELHKLRLVGLTAVLGMCLYSPAWGEREQEGVISLFDRPPFPIQPLLPPPEAGWGGRRGGVRKQETHLVRGLPVSCYCGCCCACSEEERERSEIISENLLCENQQM
jgi:hypothetical protein